MVEDCNQRVSSGLFPMPYPKSWKRQVDPGPVLDWLRQEYGAIEIGTLQHDPRPQEMGIEGGNEVGISLSTCLIGASCD